MAAYSPKQPLPRATTLGLQAAAVGTMVSALRNALGTHAHGAMGVLTRTGGTIGLFGASCASLSYRQCSFRSPNSCCGCYIRIYRSIRRESAGERRCPKWCSWSMRRGFPRWHTQCVVPPKAPCKLLTTRSAGSLPVAVTGCAVMGAIVGGYDYLGHLSPSTDETVADRRKKFFKHPPDFSVDPRPE